MEMAHELIVAVAQRSASAGGIGLEQKLELLCRGLTVSGLAAVLRVAILATALRHCRHDHHTVS